MKTTFLSIVILISTSLATFSQCPNNTFPVNGNTGIKTTSPSKALTIGGNLNCPDVAIQLRYDLEIPYYGILSLCTPGIPSVQDIKGYGLNLADMDSKLLQKIEELTLYVIQLNKDNEELRREIKILRSKGE